MKYKDLIDALCMRSNHVLIHGMAGTGKSELIQRVSKRRPCLKLAPTGLAAYHIGGSTIDNFLTCFKYKKNSTLHYVEKNYDCIIVDEVSMVPYFKTDELIRFLYETNQDGYALKLILIGDPFQLPPVVPDNTVDAYSQKEKRQMVKSEFNFFESRSFGYIFNNAMECFYLEKNYRQNDPDFIDILKKIAAGSVDQHDMDYFNGRIIDRPQESWTKYTPIITTHRQDAGNFNKLGLNTLSDKFINKPQIEWLREDGELKNEFPDVFEPVEYGTNAPIVFTQNDPEGRWVNGTSGRIVSIEQNGIVPHTIQVLTDRNETVRTVPTTHVLYKLVYDERLDTVNNECVASVKKLPFMLGYAMTVHKCQGMTLNKMSFNLGAGCFAPGQLYVALSRTKTLQGLFLHGPLRAKDVTVSDRVHNYFRSFLDKCVRVA